MHPFIQTFGSNNKLFNMCNRKVKQDLLRIRQDRLRVLLFITFFPLPRYLNWTCLCHLLGLTGCAFFTDGVFSTHMKFIEPNIEANVTIPMRPKCQLRLLVVGGGGYAGYGGGGGSGYIQYYTHSTTITSTSAELRHGKPNKKCFWTFDVFKGFQLVMKESLHLLS